ncbi:hypothetical protein ACHAXS_003784 [Conticribra weissflogii]
MGNSKSKSSSGTLSIVLDPSPTGKPHILAGQTLSGSLYAQSTARIEPSPINIDAYLSGKERSRVRYTESESYTDSQGNSQTRTKTSYRYADREIVRMTIPLAQIAAGVDAGAKYRFPFQIQLPPDLPSSMFCSENHRGGKSGGYCEIEYKIKAELKGSGRFFNYKVERLINVVSAPLPPQPVPHLIPPVKQKVNFLCCFDVGTITMGARVENTRVGKGETASIDFACKNQSRRGIDRVEATITEEVEWSAGGRSNSMRRRLASRTFRPDERWIKLSKEEMRSLKSSAKSPTSTFRNEEQSILEEIHRAIHDGENRVALDIASTSYQSYLGALIKVNHHLKIKVFTSGLCTHNPKVRVPLYIGTPSSFGGNQGTTNTVEQSQYDTVPTVEAVPSAPYIHSAPYVATAMPEPSAPPAEWASAVTATPFVMTQSAAVVGGGKIYQAEGENAHDNESPDGEVQLAIAEVVPSLPNLIQEIQLSVGPLSTIHRRLTQQPWKRAVFDPMTPNQYASVIRAVGIEFDQPDVAAALAPAVRGGSFTHEYVIAAIRAVSEWLRTPMIGKLLPLCIDLEANSGKILNQLSDWEKVCTQQNFRDALQR